MAGAPVMPAITRQAWDDPAARSWRRRGALDRGAATREKRGHSSTRSPVPDTQRPQARLTDILRVFTTLGMASFGGGLPGWMHREVVLKRNWMGEEAFLAGIALGQVLPGPNSVNLALYIGQQLRGWPGAAMAFLGILGPPFLFILGLALLYGWGGGVAGLGAVLTGVAAAGLANSLTVGLRTARRMKGWWSWAIVAATFVAIGILRLPMIPVVLVLAPASIGLAWRSGRHA
jgi:chromate transporter